MVDCACGLGLGTRTFAEAGAAHVFGFDVDESTVSAVASACRDLPVTCIVGDATNLPLHSESVDVFISFETIEHVVEPDAALREAHRVLKSGGLLICSTPNRNVYSPGHERGSRPWNRFHKQEYSSAEFDAVLRLLFTNVANFGQNPTSSVAVACLRRLGTLLPWHGAVRIRQSLKLLKMPFDRREKHAVQPALPGVDYEFSVAICTK